MPIGSVFGRMRTCTDILPWRIEGDVSAIVGDTSISDGDRPATYADATLILPLCVGKLRALWCHP
ncbi:hypothetical protein [Mesorhizobium shonense]|uniref:hypothetical protein n=1 Tax=Mesorhizobium shonense TaxID=1209948 RepID=UPI00339B71AC